MNDDLDLPFEGQEPTETDLGHNHVAGGVVIMPALVYRFAKADGTGFYPPITLVLTAGQADKLIDLTKSAVARAVEVAGS